MRRTQKGIPRNPAGLSRLELAAMAKWLRDEEGMTQAEIADELLVSRTYASSLLTDPDGSKDRERKAKYNRRCPGYDGDCGKPMYGVGRQASMLCIDCATAKAKAERLWTRESIVAAFRLFYETIGRPPTVVDVHRAPSIVRRLSGRRLAELDEVEAAGLHLPHPYCVSREFGSWTDGLAAAGFPPNPLGRAGDRRWYEPTSGTYTPPPTSPDRNVPAGWIGFCPSCGASGVRLDPRSGWCALCTKSWLPEQEANAS